MLDGDPMEESGRAVVVADESGAVILQDFTQNPFLVNDKTVIIQNAILRYGQLQVKGNTSCRIYAAGTDVLQIEDDMKF